MEALLPLAKSVVFLLSRDSRLGDGGGAGDSVELRAISSVRQHMRAATTPQAVETALIPVFERMVFQDAGAKQQARCLGVFAVIAAEAPEQTAQVISALLERPPAESRKAKLGATMLLRRVCESASQIDRTEEGETWEDFVRRA
jgi:hypothetical protein